MNYNVLKFVGKAVVKIAIAVIVKKAGEFNGKY